MNVVGVQENWSIPYKREELLGVCLEAATRLAKDGVLEQNDAARYKHVVFSFKMSSFR